jgi:hypothetical protein
MQHFWQTPVWITYWSIFSLAHLITLGLGRNFFFKLRRKWLALDLGRYGLNAHSAESNLLNQFQVFFCLLSLTDAKINQGREIERIPKFKFFIKTFSSLTYSIYHPENFMENVTLNRIKRGTLQNCWSPSLESSFPLRSETSSQKFKVHSFQFETWQV